MSETRNAPSLLEVQSDFLFDILYNHGVFNAIEGEWLEVEERSFRNRVKQLSDSSTNHLELTYSSGVTLVIKLTKNEKQEAVFKDINTYVHPWDNKNFNYDALNDELQRVLGLITNMTVEGFLILKEHTPVLAWSGGEPMGDVCRECGDFYPCESVLKVGT